MFDDKNLVDKIMAEPGALLIVQAANDRLKNEQQRRQAFYDLITEDDKAEFVNGEIIFHSPVVKVHNAVTKYLLKLLDTFVEEHDLGFVGVEKILTKFTRNDYEPDICFFGNEKASLFHDNQLFFPVPDFVVEVLSKSSQKAIEHDTVTKHKDYELQGVAEYWIVDPHERVVEQHLLENGTYRLVLKSGEGTIHSQAVKGFSIPIAAIFDKKENRKALLNMLK
ncbi:MAG: Uma2 family endonuclease [Lewinellaceae bacterium]|nr:Uma2 family endonuclease [Saprospiraceae bacterium]MCB9340436.1 Uma2 family endonuclease [Lewinellaceae bacterium]